MFIDFLPHSLTLATGDHIERTLTSIKLLISLGGNIYDNVSTQLDGIYIKGLVVFYTF